MSIIKANTFQDRGGNTILSSDGAGTITASSSLASSVASVGGIDNTPAFKAYLTGSSQSIASDTVTKIQFNSELYDTNSCYDNSTNYRFTPTVSGKYFLLAKVRLEAASFTNMELKIIKNGNTSDRVPPNSIWSNLYGTISYTTQFTSGVLEANGSTDYFEVYIEHDKGTNVDLSATFGPTFEGYKLI